MFPWSAAKYLPACPRLMFRMPYGLRAGLNPSPRSGKAPVRQVWPFSPCICCSFLSFSRPSSDCCPCVYRFWISDGIYISRPHKPAGDHIREGVKPRRELSPVTFWSWLSDFPRVNIPKKVRAKSIYMITRTLFGLLLAWGESSLLEEKA